jgi:hypothetical protein
MCGKMCGKIQICNQKSVANAPKENHWKSLVKINVSDSVDDPSASFVRVGPQDVSSRRYERDSKPSGTQILPVTLLQSKSYPLNIFVTSVISRLQVGQISTALTIKMATLSVMWLLLTRVATLSTEVIRQQKTPSKGLGLLAAYFNNSERRVTLFVA